MYTSERLSLAVLETLVHIEPDMIPPDLLSYEIDVPQALQVRTVSAAGLPQGWQEEPGHPALRAMGDDWVASHGSAALLVPSALVPEEMNLLINPAHRDAARTTIARSQPFRFDLRLIRE